MKKILLTFTALLISATTLYAAAVPDDDSAIYSPYPAQPQTEQTAPAPKPATPNKKPAPKKKAPVKKPTPKKTSATKTRKPAPVRVSSLQKGIELMQQERYEKAKPYLLKAIQEERNNPNAWYWYGVYHEKTGGFYQAQYFYSKAVTIDPAFEPLSRVVFYPNDDEKTPLWDPKHPARVYPVETASVPMNVSTFPNAPDDPEIPQVPVYTPPEPGASPLDGDSWNPSVYVPPRPEELPDYNQAPVYMPPDAGGVIADEERASLELPAQYEPRNDDIITERDKVMRVDKPLYNPPEPGQRVIQPPKAKAPEQNRQSVKAPAQKESQPKKSATVPANRVVRQKKASTTVAKTPAKTVRQNRRSQRKSESQDVTPQTQTQRPSQNRRQQNQSATQNRQSQNQSANRNQRQQNESANQNRRQQNQTPTPVPPPARQTQPQPPRRENEYMPPVGQYAPDPGTIPDRPMPPVGQGNQN